MDHVAIMRPAWGLLPKILSGEKIIESRWYKNKSAPWGKINPGDTIYFKDSGKQVTLKAKVKKVLTFENLTTNEVSDILEKYGKEDGIPKEQINFYFDLFKNKNYCLLIYLDKVQKVKPFDINKKGFGAMAAWICLEDISKIKK